MLREDCHVMCVTRLQKNFFTTHQVILEFKGPDYIIGLEDTPGVSSEILVIVLLATTRDCVKTRLASNLKRGRHEKKDTEQTTRYVLQRDAYMDEDTKRQ